MRLNLFMRCLATMFLLALEATVVLGATEGVLEAVVELAVQVQRPAGQ